MQIKHGSVNVEFPECLKCTGARRVAYICGAGIGSTWGTGHRARGVGRVQLRGPPMSLSVIASLRAQPPQTTWRFISL